MAIIVQKYGGSSVGTLERIKHVANRVIEARKLGHDVVVVVSAMQGETDRLIGLANNLSENPTPREYDILVSTGEQVSMSLLAMTLNDQGCPAKSYNGPQIGVETDNLHTNARILKIDTNLIFQNFSDGNVVIVAGFQGKNEFGDTTTLGRGGSDTTAVALAVALKANECQIYTDVDGVFTTDPRVIPEASMLSQISFEEMLEMASLGAKVLQMRAVEIASKHSMPIRVLSTFTNNHPGTLVTFEDQIMQKRLVSGIAFNREEAIITINDAPNKAGLEGYILSLIGDADIEIDMIVQNATSKDASNFTFTLNRKDYTKALDIVEKLSKNLSAASIQSDKKVAKLSLIGTGMRSHTGVASKMFRVLGELDINIKMITTSEIKISVVIDEERLEDAIRAIHQTFELDKVPEEANRAFLEL